MTELVVQRHDIQPSSDSDVKFKRQLWVGAARGLEMHFVMTGADGAVCFRTGGGTPDAVRFHWRDEERSKGSKHLDECPVLDGDPCWSDKFDEQVVQAAAAAFANGAEALWGFLGATYMFKISE